MYFMVSMRYANYASVLQDEVPAFDDPRRMLTVWTKNEKMGTMPKKKAASLCLGDGSIVEGKVKGEEGLRMSKFIVGGRRCGGRWERPWRAGRRCQR